MKFCPQCGAQNKDEAKFCVDCGADIQNIASAQPKTETPQPQATPQSSGEKKTWVAPLLNVIGGLLLYALSGIGHALYLKLYNRAAIIGALGLLISAVSFTIMCFYDGSALYILSCIGIGIMIYSAYDAYKCSQAINEGRELPALFGMRPESMSRGKATGIAVVALVLFIVALAAFVTSPTVTDATSASLADNIISDSSSDDIITDADDTSSSSDDKTKSNDDKSKSSDDEGVQIKISYPGEWSASVGDESRSTSYKGTGDDVIKIDSSKYDVIAAAVQKTDGGSDKLKVKIIRDGDTLDSESTTEDFGVVTVSATL